MNESSSHRGLHALEAETDLSANVTTLAVRGLVAMGGDTPQLASLVARVRGEYGEMPGLRLTFAQACRLWHVDISTCEMLLEQLVRDGFLCKTDKGAYIAAPNDSHTNLTSQGRCP